MFFLFRSRSRSLSKSRTKDNKSRSRYRSRSRSRSKSPSKEADRKTSQSRSRLKSKENEEEITQAKSQKGRKSGRKRKSSQNKPLQAKKLSRPRQNRSLINLKESSEESNDALESNFDMKKEAAELAGLRKKRLLDIIDNEFDEPGLIKVILRHRRPRKPQNLKKRAPYGSKVGMYMYISGGFLAKEGEKNIAMIIWAWGEKEYCEIYIICFKITF